MSEAEDRGPRKAPALELPDTAGEPWALPEGPAAASATVVVWTCNHCPYALAWHDRLVDVATDYGDRGLRMAAVNSNDPKRYPADGPEAMRERFERERWPFPYLFDADQEAARAWGARTTPHVFVLDPEQRIVWEGAPDGDHQDPGQGARWLREALDAVLAGERPPPSREPVGCSIKWS